MKVKKVICILSAIMLVLVGGVSAHADNNYKVDAVQAPSYVVTPNYVYLSTVGSTLSIESGYATCSGFINIFKNYDTDITITLQQSSNGISWSNIKSWSQSFTGIGVHSIEKGYYVNSGYTYRVLTTAQVKNGTSILETATCYSPEKIY